MDNCIISILYNKISDLNPPPHNIFLLNDNEKKSLFNKGKIITHNSNSFVYKSQDFSIKVIFYDKNKDNILSSNDDIIRNNCNIELKILNILSEYVISNKLPHIMLPIFHGNCENIINIFKSDNYKIYNDYLKEYNKNLIYDLALIIITPWCIYNDLHYYIRQHKFSITDWKIVFFKIFFSLAVILTHYPGFRHNDLSAKNILVKPYEKTGFSYYYYNKIYYKIPNNGFQIYIWDFEFSNIYTLTDNKEIYDMEKSYGIRNNRNHYYDIHYFLNSTYRYQKLPYSIKFFIERFIPKRYLGITTNFVSQYRLINDINLYSPDDLLKDFIFNEFVIDANSIDNSIIYNKP